MMMKSGEHFLAILDRDQLHLLKGEKVELVEVTKEMSAFIIKNWEKFCKDIDNEFIQTFAREFCEDVQSESNKS